ncbi:retropepsin-like aspartic protease family protein [Pseudorhodoplanes sinuspersici]|uniref:Peptidase n=1 Tax=Pseudorhodoplanes sinuspersici TaxID=1235591 RepID=A0A1W6ZN28_9HYPH|nr:TIGR02281 family clan AA aspartic protease [Pseudorhodoplanes sinuspersici]ARP98803.1 peptidase [Pseudorhodoplanes sinuspersici]RKE69579.1 aspartyl protease family protein [Pseudorhodoplanes sinuspersici]
MRSIIVFAGLVLAAAGLIAHVLDRDPPPAAKATAPSSVAAVTVGKAPSSSAARSVTIPRDPRGHFQVGGRIDGRRVDFMVDTGASVIALTEREAVRLGIRPSRDAFTAQVKTANGTVKAAPVMLNTVDIDGLVVRNVQALVVPGNALSENLLGLSYLTKLKRFEYANGKLVLEQ